MRQGRSVSTQPGEQGRSKDGQENRGNRADASSQPHGLDSRAQRQVTPTRPQVTPRQGRRRIGQEDKKPNRRVQDGGSDAEARQLRRAQVTDHRGVDDREQRLGDERAQRRQGQREDLARRDRRHRRGRGGLIRVARHLVHPVTIAAHYTLHFLSTTCAQACG